MLIIYVHFLSLTVGAPARRHAILASVMFLFASLGALGNTYTGTITQIVTQTNDPLYHVGETFHGFYSYESSTSDGTFYGAQGPLYGHSVDTNTSLSGQIFMPFATDGFLDYTYFGGPIIPITGGEGLVQASLAYSTTLPCLTVEYGQVTEFCYGNYLGFDFGAGYHSSINSGEFFAISWASYAGADGLPDTRGTLSLGSPQPVSDSSVTLALLGGAMTGLFALRRHRIAAAINTGEA